MPAIWDRPEAPRVREAVATLIREADSLLVRSLPLDGRRPWERPDIYGGATLAAARELAEGVLAEVAANCLQNAGRLSRHLFEFRIEMSWVLKAPDERLRTRYAEDARTTLERIDAETRDAVLEEEGYDAGFLETLRQLLEEERARLGRKPDAGVMPDFGTMASDVGLREEYDRSYPAMSLTAKPGLSAAGPHVTIDGGQVGFVAKPRPRGSFVMGPLCQAAASLGACIELTTRCLGLEMTSAVERSRGEASEACRSWEDSVLSARQLRASERPEQRD